MLLLLASHPACADDLYTLQILLLPIDTKSDGFGSGERGSHTSFEILRFPKNSFSVCIDLPGVWAVALSC